MDAITLTDEQVTALTGWIQLVQMQDDMVTEEDLKRAIQGVQSDILT